MNIKEMKTTELKAMAKEKKVPNWWLLKKAELITELEKLEPEKEAKKRVKIEKDENNLITIKELAMEAGFKGSKARRIIRDAKIEKPYGRWEWDLDLHKEIVEQIKGLFEIKED